MDVASVPEGELTGVGLDTSWVGNEAPPHTREVKIATFKLERALKSNLEEFRTAYRAKRKLSDAKGPGMWCSICCCILKRGWPTTKTKAMTTTVLPTEAITRQLARPDPAGSAQYVNTCSPFSTCTSCAPPLSSPPPPRNSNSSAPCLPHLLPPPLLLPIRAGGMASRPTPLHPPHQRPLLAPTGKVLRPFTITPSTRSEVAASVFQPSYRLPTMSIDEYLAEEQRRGNIIQGGARRATMRPPVPSSAN